MRFPQAAREVEQGQSLVEMTVGMVILLIIVMGILDLGRLYFTYLTLQDAAGEAALFLAVEPCCRYDPSVDPLGMGTGCTDPNNAHFRAANSADPGFRANIMSLGLNGFNAQVADPYNTGSAISVAVHYDFEPLTPVISAIAPTIRLGATASNVVALPALSCS